jgi:ABC-2 type transport system permease protein
MSSAAASIRAWARAMPTLLRVGMAETLAYRAEFVIWILTNSLPLIMLGLWTSVAAEAPFGGFDRQDFIAYYLIALIVRNMTGSWVIWQMNDEIRTGSLSIRLLRPLHPFITYAATHLASVPLRALVAIPFAVILLWTTSAEQLTGDPLLVALFVVSLVGAWAIAFFFFTLIGALGLFIEKSIAVFQVYLGLFAVLSGYLVPLELLPEWAQTTARYAPFRYMLGFPVELLMGGLDRTEAVRDLAVQWLFAALLLLAARAVWQAGVRRYEAYGS